MNTQSRGGRPKPVYTASRRGRNCSKSTACKRRRRNWSSGTTSRKSWRSESTRGSRVVAVNIVEASTAGGHYNGRVLPGGVFQQSPRVMQRTLGQENTHLFLPRRGC